MVNVVKIKGISWFDRMAVGDENFAKRTGVDTRQEGADDTSPEKQIQIIQDLIPQKPTAITVVPNSPEALQNVLGQARAQGIKVVSHEATGIQNADIDIEAFDNAAYGRQIMQNLAQCMGQQGKYVQFVGGLTAKTHMQWVGAAHDMQVSQFPRHDPRRGPDREHRQRAGRLREGQGSARKVPGHQGLPGLGRQRRAGHRTCCPGGRPATTRSA